MDSIMLVLIYCLFKVTLADKCYKDDSLKDREGNVYHCETKDLPRCCMKEEGPTCCLDQNDKNVKEQLQLWGTVAFMLILIGVLFVCCKNDISFCKGETSMKDRWNNYWNRRSAKKEEDKQNIKTENQEGNYYDNPIGDFEKIEGHGLDPYHYPSLPSKTNEY